MSSRRILFRSLFLYIAAGALTETAVAASQIRDDTLTRGDTSSKVAVSERLLTEADRPIDSIPYLPEARRAWSLGVKTNHHPIRSLTSEDFSDLAFLKPLLRTKRVVQLGENSHGVAEFNDIRVRLIKFLHQELGYDVIAFESGLWECWAANRSAADASAALTMRSCLFGVWHTEEVLELFRYIRATHTTDRPLQLAGFDIQVSGGLLFHRLAWLRQVASLIDSSYSERIAELTSETHWNLEPVSGSSTSWANTLPQQGAANLAAFDSLAAFFVENASRIAEAPNIGAAEDVLAAQVALSTARYVRLLSIPHRPIERTELRDEGMAENLEFLLDVLYPGKKMITWGHNVHLQHNHHLTADRAPRTMGSWTAERRREEIFTVGLYMYQGQAAMNDRTIYEIRPESRPDSPWDMETLLAQSGRRFTFVHIPREPRAKESEWMDAELTFREWGVRPVRMVPSQQYDAILLIYQTSPPEYYPPLRF